MRNEILQNVDNDVFRELKSKFPDFYAQENGAKFPIATVPFVLYREIAKNLGIDDETKVTLDGRDYFIRKLDRNHITTGFDAAIGIREDRYGVLTFALWKSPPHADDADYLIRPILEISGGPYNTGGTGSSIREDLWIRLDQFGGFSLTNRSAKMVSLVLFRASQLAEDPNCVSNVYWRKDFFAAFRSSSNK